MECRICGHRANSLPAMAKHYRSKHPSKMKRREKKGSRATTRVRGLESLKEYGYKYCPSCGKKLG